MQTARDRLISYMLLVALGILIAATPVTIWSLTTIAALTAGIHPDTAIPFGVFVTLLGCVGSYSIVASHSHCWWCGK